MSLALRQTADALLRAGYESLISSLCWQWRIDGVALAQWLRIADQSGLDAMLEATDQDSE